MSNFSLPTSISLTLNFISVTAESIALLISLIILCLVIYRLFRGNRRQGQGKIPVPLILSMNTVCILIAKSIIQLVDVNWNTLKRDFHLITEQNNSFSCRFRGYMFFSVVSALYWGCALQAAFRFSRVVYPKYLWLHRSTVYLYVLIPGQIIFAFASVLPHLVFFDGMQLIPDEAYCTALMNEFASLLYLFLVVFGLPLGTISVCYICIIYKMRQASLIRPYQQRNQRDYLVIRRIMLVVVILNIASLPAVIDLIICVPRNHLDPLIYRIEWVSASVNALIFAISLPFITPQVRELFKRSLKSRSKIVIYRPKSTFVFLSSETREHDCNLLSSSL